MANKVGNLIKDARTKAEMTQAELSKKAGNVTAQEISKAERGELKLSDDQLKAIAKAAGVTQKSLIEAAASSKYPKAAASKKETSSKKETASSSKSSKKESDITLTASEKTIIELYRKADADTKKRVKAILKGEEDGLSGILSSITGSGKNSKKEDGLSTLITSLTGEDKKENKKEDKDGGLLQSIIQNAAKDLLK